MRPNAPIRRFNLSRGLRATFGLGFMGFAIAVFVIAVRNAIRWYLDSEPVVVRPLNAEVLFEHSLEFVVLITSIFAAVGWASAAPVHIQSRLSVIINIVIACAVLYPVLVPMTAHPRIKSVNHPPLYLSEFLVLAGTPILVGLFLSFWPEEKPRLSDHTVSFAISHDN